MNCRVVFVCVMECIIAEMVGMAIGWMENVAKIQQDAGARRSQHGIFIGRTSMQYSACG